jgi:hypothetical protein
MNHNLGLVAVLFIIIIMNQNDSGYLEGFDIKNIGQKVKKPTTLDASGNTAEDDVSDDDKKIAIKNAMKNAMKKAKASTKSTTKESFVGGREGFNMIYREGTILKG